MRTPQRFARRPPQSPRASTSSDTPPLAPVSVPESQDPVPVSTPPAPATELASQDPAPIVSASQDPAPGSPPDQSAASLDPAPAPTPAPAQDLVLPPQDPAV